MTTIPPLVGLIGKKRVGKDTFASVLVEEFGFARVAFADPLKEMALTIDPIIDAYDADNSCSDPDCCGGPWPDIQERRLGDVVAHVGWEGAKDTYPEARRFLQRLGDGVRQFDPEFWLRVGMREARALRRGGPDTAEAFGPGQPVVVTDVRYPNEADAIRDAGGILIRIVRDGVDDGDTHASETALDDYEVDATVPNRDLETFKFAARQLAWQQGV